ncbi:MAG: hypothetical protein B7Y61_12720 [Rhizobiales bacterium 35-66-30]|nr:MAG: hypothetical protein B7Y61_12720 [Rhizobiales bacterium 35-66-30]OZA94457.1 MAG: hypothetical protein B7X67_26915 [Rhizobiales bacterium 39-66-18]
MLLFPDTLGDYPSYRAYFAAKRKWFFGFFALSQVLDQIDSWIKGADYFLTLGWPYSVTTGLLVLMSIVAMFSSNGRFQAAFLALGLINEVGWIFWLLHTVN